VIRRVRVEWPDRRLFAGGREAVRLLAVSDAVDPALAWSANRDALGRIDLVVGCGDLEPDALAFLIDAFPAPSVHVRGNHDTGSGWSSGAHLLPKEARSGVPICLTLASSGVVEVVPFGWAGAAGTPARRDEGAAWRHVLGTVARRTIGRRAGRPFIVISHAPPFGAGDTLDPYHRGFRGYRWLLERTRPVLWLHGHTPLASAPWRVTCGRTTLVNVTGAVLVELVPAAIPAHAAAPGLAT
jgi:hypothetical protein